MRQAMAIAVREIEERRFVPYAAVSFAILPFVLSAIPAISGRSPREVIAMAAMLLAAGFTLGLSVILGASFVGRDLSDGRLSFYFSRPVAPSSIWFGKLLAALALIGGCFAVIAIPAWAVAHDRWLNIWTMPFVDGARYVLGAAVALLLLSHVISTLIRSRSALVGLDFAALVAAAAAIYWMVLALARGGAATLIFRLSYSLAAALALAIVIGGAWQLEHGRIERRRNHAALSQFLWGVFGAAVVIGAAYVAWVIAAKPGDLYASISASQSRDGIAFLSGQVRDRADYHAGFLIDSAAGKTLRVAPSAAWSVRFSDDGRTAVWLQPIGRGEFEFVTYSRGMAAPSETGITSDGGNFVLSGDGRRLAVFGRDNAAVYDIAQRRSLMSAHLSAGVAQFVTPDVVRLFDFGGDGVDILEMNVAARTVAKVGALPRMAGIGLSPSADRMLVRERGRATATLRDGHGTVLATLNGGAPVERFRILADRRIIFIDEANVLHVLSPDAAEQRAIALGAPEAWCAGEHGPRLFFQSGKTAMIVNIDAGRVERRLANVHLLPGNGPELYVIDSSSRLNSVNPETGAMRAL